MANFRTLTKLGVDVSTGGGGDGAGEDITFQTRVLDARTGAGLNYLDQTRRSYS